MAPLIVVGVFCAYLAFQDSSDQPISPPELSPSAVASDPAVEKTSGTAPDQPLSEAEQIAALTRAIKDDEDELKDYAASLKDAETEYAEAESDFNSYDTQIRELREALEDATKAGDKNAADQARADIKDMEKTWALAKDRFDLAIDARKLTKKKYETLKQKLAQERKALDLLTGNAAAAPASENAAAGESQTGSKPAQSDSQMPATGTPSPGANPSNDAGADASATAPAADAGPSASTPPAAAANPLAPGGIPVTPAAAVTAASGASEPKTSTPAPSDVKPPSAELLRARADARAKAAAAKKAEIDAKSLSERMVILDETIGEEKILLQTARRKADNAHAARTELSKALRERSVEGAPQEELQAIVRKVEDAEQRFREARQEVAEGTDRLDDLQSERAELLAEQNAALRKAKASEEQVKIAESTIQRLQNPFSPHNILQWLLDHVPKLIAIVVGMMFLLAFSRASTRRIVDLVSRRGMRGTKEEREDRARTLVGVFHNAVSVAAVGGGALMMCQEIGIPIAPLMGGAAVVGLAVAFGAQNLIRDYFYGFVILLENQYKLNDVVRIGSTSGQVEQITLRMTVLRDLEGSVHFIPNGEINSVTNMTHGWSRALFDLGVAYKEDADRVMQVVHAIGQELRADRTFGPLILEDLTMLGVDELADSAVIIKFYIKTKPLQQWNVKREMLRRIKRRFDELNIEIPFPHRTVYFRNDSQAEPAAELAHAPHDRPRNRQLAN